MLFKNRKPAGTSFEAKCSILADIWLNHRTDDDFEAFCEYNDIGLPLAYMLDNDIVVTTETATKFVEETFGLLLEGLEISDTGFESLEDILGADADDDEDEDFEDSSTTSFSKFCGSCGAAHESASVKFCASCGAARI